MASLVRAGATVVFTPGVGWAWDGFDGGLPVAAGHDRLSLPGGHAVVDEDLTRLANDLVGKGYKAVGHDSPGAVSEASVGIDAGTLFARVRIDGREAAKSDTTGTFTIRFLPSRVTGPPVVPDAAPERNGTWAIRPPADTRTDC